ncbi:MAG: hypothetical protein ACXU82_19090 [Caulobacteraceae bacterium]
MHGQNQLLRQLMQMARANASQEDAPGAASSAQSAQGDQGDQQGPAPAPPAAGSTPAGMFSGSTLGALTSAQERAGDWRQKMDADLAGKIVSQLDSDGDGSLSLSEIEKALGVPTSATSASDAADASGAPSSTKAQDRLSAAFAQVDANGDGQLSTDELTTALNQTPVHHGWGHHHQHGAPPADALASDASPPAVASSGSTTASTGDATTGTDASSTGADVAQAAQAFATQVQQQAASVEDLLQPSSSTGVTA